MKGFFEESSAKSFIFVKILLKACFYQTTGT
jgi:hypothetical protein